MEEDTEVLDWGNEDDEIQVQESYRTNGQDDAEDAVSLGGDEDDEIYPYQAASHEDAPMAQQSLSRSSHTPQHTSHEKYDLQREEPGTPQKPPSRATDSAQLRRSQSLGQMTHALPPKPTFAPPPSPHATPATTATLASAMVFRDRRSNGHSKNVSSSRDRGTGLPPDWEERYSRTGKKGLYYYNAKTHESTWDRPGFVDSGSSSPAKGRDAHGIRMKADIPPRHDVSNDLMHSPSREGQRRISADGTLTYNDRHYRPTAAGALPGTGPTLDIPSAHGTIPRPPPRPLSPRDSDRRRDTRSVSPSSSRRYANSLERPGRSHRELSPPPTERAAPRRNVIDANDANQRPVQDRAWDRSRPSQAQNDTRGRDFLPESRGRRLRDDVHSEPLRNDQEHRASRPRSPPSHPRDSLPPRRYPDHDATDRDTRQKSRFDRPPSPSAQHTRVENSYAPENTIPQRRARDYDAEHDFGMKRRRVDEDSNRRRPSPDRDSFSPALDRHSSQLDTSSAKKRAPLPPQSEHFQQVARGRPPTDLPTSHTPSYASQADSHPDSRGPAAYSDASSASRGPRASFARENEPRHYSSRPRYDNARVDDVMDVDYHSQTSRSGSSRTEPPPARPRGNDRPALDLQMETLPKGPRAMSRAHGSVSHTPPSPSPVLPSVPVRMPEPSANGVKSDRGPQPHLRQDAIPPSRAAGLPSGPRRYGDYSETERRPSRFQDIPSNKDTPARYGRRDDELQQSGPKPLGTMNIPVGGNRPLSAIDPSDPPARSPVIDKTHAQHASNIADPPSYRPPPRQWADRPHVSVPGRGSVVTPPAGSQFNAPPPNPLPRSLDDAPPASTSRSGRQSRFAPIVPIEPEPSEAPRIWLTREESLSQNGPPEIASSRDTRGSDAGRDMPPARYDQTDYRRRDREDVAPRQPYYSNSTPPSTDRRNPVGQRSAPYAQPPNMRAAPESGARGYPRDPPHHARDRRDSSYHSRGENDDSRTPMHSDRGRGFEPPLAPTLPGLPHSGIKPGVGRGRPDHTSEYRDTPPYEGPGYQETLDADGGSRPPVRRGASLLDRLSLSDPPPPPLTERLQDPPKRGLPEIIGLPPRPSAETTLDAEMNAALESGRGRGKKRAKRGRRIDF